MEKREKYVCVALNVLSGAPMLLVEKVSEPLVYGRLSFVVNGVS